MSKRFGKTWWGEKWLQSLNDIDYSNRLPRGRAYAGKGAVKYIEIQTNVIRAEVAGSRHFPYEVEIEIPIFSQAEKHQFVKEISAQPGIISKMLSRKLDPYALNIANRCGLKVFPSSWEDFSMICSCPDWAVPCKHLAAVIYQLSLEVDNNPFLIFELHGLNLLKVLSEAGIEVNEKSMNIPDFTEKLGSVSDCELSSSEKELARENAYRKIEFSGIKPLLEQLCSLLSDNPTFYNKSGDFKKKYSIELGKVCKQMDKIVDGKVLMDEVLEHFDIHDHIKLEEDSAVSAVLHGDYYFEISIDNELVEVPELMRLLGRIDAGKLEDFTPEIAALHTTLLCSIHLLSKGAVVPEIVKIPDSGFVIRWVPALLSAEVKSFVSQLEVVIPPWLLEYEDQEGRWDAFDQRAVNLLSVFITEWIHLLSRLAEENVFLEMFFDGRSYEFEKPGELALSGGIQGWLSTFFIGTGRFVPQMQVHEFEDQLFEIELLVKDTKKVEEGSFPLAEVIKEEQWSEYRYDILKSFTRLDGVVPQLDEYFSNHGDFSITLDIEEFQPFLLNSIPLISLLGIALILPKSIGSLLKPKPSLTVDVKDPTKPYFSIDELLRFDWKVAIGDETIDPDKFMKMVSRSSGLLKYKSNYIYISPSELKALQKRFEASRQPSRIELLRSALSGEFEGAKVDLSKRVINLLEELRSIREVPLPKNLNAQLRPYQKRGFAWMYKNSKFGFGSIIADDMGLGKTIQVISTILKFREEGLLQKDKALVICPTGLLVNWKSEFEKFAPDIHAEIYHGTSRVLPEKYEVLITSYGIARSDANILSKKKWWVLVIDEAQNIKNSSTRVNKAVNSIPARNRIAMSGTPVENRLSELWSIVNFTNKGLLGNAKEFKSEFGNPIEIYNDQQAAAGLKKIIGPFMMRRLKTDKQIISDLPEKMEINCYARLNPAQVSLYEATLLSAMKEIKGIEVSDSQGLFKKRSLVLQLIVSLKQICNHPTHFLKNNDFRPELSGKVQLLFEKLNSIVENREKVLIFTQFREMGELLKMFIREKMGVEPMFYHGGTSVKMRERMIDRFQNNKRDRMFILSLRAAGTGLNLTAAQHVIHFDLWWNPAVESQATDRAYRIGQAENVMVHRFITRDTFEEKIDRIIQSKKALAEMTIVSGEKWLGSLSDSELDSIFTLQKS